MSEAKPVVDMPAGHARDEQLRVNADHLAEQAETLSDKAERYAMDPRAFEPDRDILQHFNSMNELEVSDALPDYVYGWFNWKNANGSQITAKLTKRIRDPETGRMTPCWEVVSGDMPESLENKDVNGYRRIGDVMLMRCRVDRYKMLQRYEQAILRQREEGAEGALLEMEEQSRRRGGHFIVHVNSPLSDPTVRAQAQRAAAKGIAREKFYSQVRHGEVRGLTPGR